MKKLIFSLFLSILTLSASADAVEGIKYCLPKTALHFRVTVEKTQYKPGEYAAYARRYLKKNVSQEPQTTYRILGIQMTPKAMPDTSKQFTLLIDKKHSISHVERTDDGRLLAINTTATKPNEDTPELANGTQIISGQYAAPLNPRDYMTQDILQAGSTAKIAELTAQEIYDIRDSRNQLSRGEADYMPKDGSQLKMMLANLNTQEEALVQLFEGTTQKDTIAVGFDFVPEKEGQSVLFRFSKWLGVVDSDDLSGEPYYIVVADNHSVNDNSANAAGQDEEKKKEDKNDIGLRTNMPGKATVKVVYNGQDVDSYSVVLPQFGSTENLSGDLFGKKQSAKIVLSPVTGSIVSIDQISLD